MSGRDDALRGDGQAGAPAEGLDETSAKAHYSLGVLMASSGRSSEAISHLSAAVEYNPNYVEALWRSATRCAEAGRFERR